MSEQRFKQALVVLGLLALIAIVSMFSTGRSMARFNNNRLAEQLMSRLEIPFKDARAQCASSGKSDCLRPYVEMAAWIFLARADDTDARLKLIQREFDKRPDIYPPAPD